MGSTYKGKYRFQSSTHPSIEIVHSHKLVRMDCVVFAISPLYISIQFVWHAKHVKLLDMKSAASLKMDVMFWFIIEQLLCWVVLCSLFYTYDFGRS